MNSGTISFPPLRDLPPGHLEARKRQLLDELPRGPAIARRRTARRVLLVAVAAAALAGASVAIAAGFGAFDGISAAQQTQTGTDVLPQGILDTVNRLNAQATEHNQSAAAVAAHFRIPLLLPDTARVLGTMPDGSKVYGLTDTRGELCLFGEGTGSCGSPLDHSRPITLTMSNVSPTTGGTFIVQGVATDDVSSVSFTVGGKNVTVPVEKNIYIYKEPDSHATGVHCVVAHLADGSTVDPFPEVPCP